MSYFIVPFYTLESRREIGERLSNDDKIICLTTNDLDSLQQDFPNKKTYIELFNSTLIDLKTRGQPDSEVVDNTDKIWEQISKHIKGELALFNAVFRDSHSHNYFKKIVSQYLLKLFNSYEIRKYLALNGTEAKILISDRFVPIVDLSQCCPLYKLDRKYVDFFPRSFEPYSLKTVIANLFLFYSHLIFGILNLVLPKKPKKVIELALRHYQSSIEFNHDPPLDWIVHFGVFNTKNCAIISEGTPSNEFVNECEKRDFHLINSKKSLAPWNASFSASKKIFGYLFEFHVFILRSLFINRPLLLNETFVAMRIWLRWTNILDKYQIQNYLSYNDIDPHNVIRGVMLNKGTETISYLHSVHTTNSCELESKMDFVMWSYNSAKKRLHWGTNDAEEFQQCHGMLGKPIVTGPIHSPLHNAESITKVRKFIPEEQREKKIISIFDSTYGFNGCLYTPDYAPKFIQIICDALHYRSDKYVFVLKEKWDTESLKLHLGNFFEVYLEIIMKNSIVRVPVEARLSTPSLINISELTISMAFSSTSVVAMGQNIPGIFLEPSGKMKNSLYANLSPNLVAYDSDGLRAISNYWLDQSKNEQILKLREEFGKYGWTYKDPQSITQNINREFRPLVDYKENIKN